MNGLIKSLVVPLASLSDLNTVRVDDGAQIRSKSGKGRRYTFQVGARTENYFRRGNLSWSGERMARMAVSDFNGDGINDVLFFSQASKNGMMATYDERSRAFLLVPVAFDR